MSLVWYKLFLCKFEVVPDVIRKKSTLWIQRVHVAHAQMAKRGMKGVPHPNSLAAQAMHVAHLWTTRSNHGGFFD
jgi:hypothetical protein